MNDSDIDIRVALALLAQPAASQEAKEALKENLGTSPLARGIAAYVASRPAAEFSDLLARIAELNQGKVEDFASQTFRDYLVTKLGATADQVNRSAEIFATFARAHLITAREDEADALYAAKPEDTEGF